MSPDDWRPWNSPNHGGIDQGEGQNVLYADAHASWANTPKAGMSSDNIYTSWGVLNAERKVRATGLEPKNGETSGYSWSTKDALLYP